MAVSSWAHDRGHLDARLQSAAAEAFFTVSRTQLPQLLLDFGTSMRGRKVAIMSAAGEQTPRLALLAPARIDAHSPRRLADSAPVKRSTRAKIAIAGLNATFLKVYRK